MKKKNIIIIILLLLVVPIIVLNGGMSNVKADSGFDASYDSGGWDSGGWDSGGWSSSDYDYDYSWSNSSSSSSRHHSSNRGSYSYTYNSTGSTSSGLSLRLFGMIIVIFLIGLFILTIDTKRSTNNIRFGSSPNQHYRAPRYLSDEEVKKYIPDFDYYEFVEARYQDYVTIQNAWSKFDYSVLREKLTDELYNQYIFQLDSMKIKREENIMNGFTLAKGNIIGISEVDGKLELRMEMVVSFYDYIVQDGNIVRGSKDKRVNICYELTFVCDKTIDIDKCPNCHAPLTDSSSQVCEYCRTIITRTGNSWVMSKKINRNQW